MHLDVQGLTACFASLHSCLKCDRDSFTKEVQIMLHWAPDSRGQKRSRNVACSLCDMTVIQEAGGGEMQGLPKVAHSPLELFSFCVWWGWCENITSNRRKKRGMSIIVYFSSCWKREFRLLFQKHDLHHRWLLSSPLLFSFLKSLKVIMISTQSVEIGTFADQNCMLLS